MSKIFFLLIIFALVPTSSYAQKTQGPANVNVVNNPTVVVGNTPNVVVGNTPDNPVAVRQVGEQRQLFQVGGVVNWQCSQGSAVRTFEVPAGKRFVIESVSFRNMVTLQPGEAIRAELTATFEGVPRSRPLDFRQQQFGQTMSFVATHPLLAYADAGASVTLNVFASNPTGISCDPNGSEQIVRGFITGYLIDMPQ